nr:hypothetical protein BaRGS_014809 [Batillaria attramentaria]
MRVHVYLDDWLVLAGSQDMCSLHTRSVLEQAAALGFRLNLQKSDLVPAQQFKFLEGSFKFKPAVDYRQAWADKSRESSAEFSHSSKPTKILINLCVALALSNLVFLVGMQEYAFNNHVACKVVSVLLHYSLLASLCWMLVEGFYMYLALVKVFMTKIPNFVWKSAIVGWGVPLVIVVITVSVNNTDNYKQLHSGICWLTGPAFYASFLAPVCFILLSNFMVFILVLRVLLGLTRHKIKKEDSSNTAKHLRRAVGVAILLGLTWVFGVLAVGKATVAFNFLFAIFNSLQASLE